MDVEAFSAGQDDVSGFYTGQGERRAGKPRSLPRKQSLRTDLPRHEPGERFIQGPIPLEWMKAAAMCGQRAEAVALLLWYAARWQKANPVKLTPKILAELGVHPKTARRVLGKMEAAGLVRAEFHRGRSPVVTITKPERTAAL